MTCNFGAPNLGRMAEKNVVRDVRSHENTESDELGKAREPKHLTFAR